jgi:hypothetical protein
METTIRSAFNPSTPSQELSYIDKVIDILKRQIQDTQPININHKIPYIFNVFKSLLLGKEVFRHFVMHCEAALAVFAKFGTEATSSSYGMARDSLV